MKILVIAATWMEVRLLADEMEFIEEKSHNLKEFRYGNMHVDILISGIGTTFTTFHLTSVLKDNKYHMVVNVGIAGSLTRDLEMGETVMVVADEFADLGIEKENEFLTLFESGFVDANEFPFENGLLKASDGIEIPGIKKVRGITTNKSHGRNTSIMEITGKYSAQVETMEGAAIFYVCNWLGVPCFQIRSISNYVEPRDAARWNIPLALENLKNSIVHVFKKLAVPVN